VTDSNAPVQEKALDALIAFLKGADADVGRWLCFFLVEFRFLILLSCLIFVNVLLKLLRYAKEVLDAIVAKCLTGRPKTVEKAQTVLLLWVELEAVEAFLVQNWLSTIPLPGFDVFTFVNCSTRRMI